MNPFSCNYYLYSALTHMTFHGLRYGWKCTNNYSYYKSDQIYEYTLQGRNIIQVLQDMDWLRLILYAVRLAIK